MKTISDRQVYINKKTLQLDKITDAHKYSNRLSKIIKYHKLLTEKEMSTVHAILKGVI